MSVFRGRLKVGMKSDDRDCSTDDKEVVETGRLKTRICNRGEKLGRQGNGQGTESEVDRRWLGRQSRKMSRRLTGYWVQLGKAPDLGGEGPHGGVGLAAV